MALEPNGEELWNESEAYEALTSPVEPFLLGTLTFVQRRLPNGDIIAREAEARGQMLSLDRRWFACTVKSYGGQAAAVEQPETPIEFGMSGSPILGPDGHAIAVVSGGESSNPLLADALPGWLLRAAAATSRSSIHG